MNPLAMQFQNSPINLACEGFPFRTVHLPHVLHISPVYSTPEFRKRFADLGPVTVDAPDDFGARWRGKFSQRLSESLTNTLIYSMTTLDLSETFSAGA
jgi:hypothetical protein